jgi:hypothetical protein
LRNFGGTGVSGLGAEIPDKRASRKLETALYGTVAALVVADEATCPRTEPFDVIEHHTIPNRRKPDLGCVRSIGGALVACSLKSLLRRIRISVRGERHKERSPPREALSRRSVG